MFSTLREEIQHRDAIQLELTDERAHSQQLEHELMQLRHKLDELESNAAEHFSFNPRNG